jgi:hypothetical protein
MVLVATFTITAMGTVVGGAAGSTNGLDGKAVAAIWLDAFRQVAWVAGFICASVGLFISRRTRA